MTFKSLDDIEREKREQNMREMGEDISEGIDWIMKKILPERKRRRFRILGFTGKVLLFIFLLTFILGCALLLKIIIKNLFLGG